MNGQRVPRGRVLVVDDHEEIREGMKALLEMEEMDVVTHDSMITLPLVLRAAAPDVILLDLSFGALSGQSFFRPDWPGTFRKCDASVLLFSGRSAMELATLAEELGADGFVSKSQESVEIIARVRTSIEQRRAIRAAAKRKVINDLSGTASALTR